MQDAFFASRAALITLHRCLLSTKTLPSCMAEVACVRISSPSWCVQPKGEEQRVYGRSKRRRFRELVHFLDGPFEVQQTTQEGFASLMRRNYVFAASDFFHVRACACWGEFSVTESFAEQKRGKAVSGMCHAHDFVSLLFVNGPLRTFHHHQTLPSSISIFAGSLAAKNRWDVLFERCEFCARDGAIK